jgi:N-acyl homoserine lactone hydrolase
VVAEKGGRPVVVGGDMAVFFAELDELRTEGRRVVRALDPEGVRLSDAYEPWRHQHDQRG